MDMSKHPKTEAAEDRVDPRHDWSNPGETWGYLIALGWIAALAAGFFFGGIAGVAAVSVTFVPVLVMVLAAIAVGR